MIQYLVIQVCTRYSLMVLVILRDNERKTYQYGLDQDASCRFVPDRVQLKFGEEKCPHIYLKENVKSC